MENRFINVLLIDAVIFCITINPLYTSGIYDVNIANRCVYIKPGYKDTLNAYEL